MSFALFLTRSLPGKSFRVSCCFLRRGVFVVAIGDDDCAPAEFAILSVCNTQQPSTETHIHTHTFGPKIRGKTRIGKITRGKQKQHNRTGAVVNHEINKQNSTPRYWEKNYTQRAGHYFLLFFFLSLSLSFFAFLYQLDNTAAHIIALGIFLPFLRYFASCFHTLFRKGKTAGRKIRALA